MRTVKDPPTTKGTRAVELVKREVHINPPTASPQEEEPLPNLPEMLPVGGRLSLYRERWTFSAWAHSIVKSGLGWKWVNSPPPLRSFYQELTEDAPKESDRTLQIDQISCLLVPCP